MVLMAVFNFGTEFEIISCFMDQNKSLSGYILYWATILSACTMGETAGDFLSFCLELGYAKSSIILAILLTIVLIWRYFSKTESELHYWATIVIMSTTGTAFADFITRTMQLGYAWGSALLITLFIIIYLAEYFYKKSKNNFSEIEESIRHNQIPKTDIFYWTSILIASTFGTTMGDFVSDYLELGFGGGSILLFSLLVILLIIQYKTNFADRFFYWSTLVVASTIGATTGDFLTKEDGLDLGYAIGSSILIAVFIVIFFTRNRLQTQLKEA